MNFTHIFIEMNHVVDHLEKQGVHREADLVTWF
jgi:hypothetical protein